MITSATAARLEIINKYSPSYSAMVADFGQSVVEDLSNKGLISDEDREYCTLTAYGRTELDKYRAENPVETSEEPSKEPPKEKPKKTRRRNREPSASVKLRMPLFLLTSDIPTLLEFFDTNEIPEDFFDKYARTDKVEKLLSYRLISVEDGIYRLTDRGHAILEKSMEEKLLHPDPYKFSIFSVLCAVIMSFVAAFQILDMSNEFISRFVNAEMIGVIDVQYMAIQLPPHFCICLGTLLYWVAVGLGSRKLSLIAVILFVCSFFCWPSLYVGIACVPVFVLGIIGYVRSGRS